MKKLFKKGLSLLLCAALLCSLAAPVFAVQRVMDGEEEKAFYTQFFNTQVNKVKSDMPYMVLTCAGGVPEGGLTISNGDGEEELDEMATKYLLPVLDGLFNNDSSITEGFIRVLFGETGVRLNEKILYRQVSRKSIVPLFGEDVVSRLTPDGDFSIIADLYENSSIPKAMQLDFLDSDLNDIEGSSLKNAFSLPSGSINPVVIGGVERNTEGFLEKVKFNEFRFSNGRINVLFDEDGNLTQYRSQITYDFKISYLDAIKLVSAILGYDLFQAFVNTYSTIARNLGKTETEIEEFLQQDKISVQYIAVVDMNKIDWRPRTFGDVDGDNVVTVADARRVLRYSVGLDLINNVSNLIYADVNFDGVVDTADSRAILRMVVGLDEKYTEVPEGKEITIADINYDPEEQEPEEDPEQKDEEKEEFNGFLDGIFDPTVKLADIAQFVFDCINGVKGVESEAMNTVQELIDIIKGIVAENRGRK